MNTIYISLHTTSEYAWNFLSETEQGLLALDEKSAPEALSHFRQALPLRRDSGQMGSVAISLEHIATAALRLDDLALAESCLRESLALFARDPEWALTSHALNRLGDLELTRGNLPAAESHYRTALETATQHESISVALDASLCLVTLAAAQRDQVRAVELAAYVEHHPASEFALKEKARANLADLEQTIEAGVFLKAVLKGQAILTLTVK